MLKTFKKILNEEDAAAIDRRTHRIKKAMIAKPQGPYGVAHNREVSKTGKTRAVKLPPSEKSIAPRYSTTLYNDSQMPGQFKQWSIWTEGRDVITEWGRTGSTLQTKRKPRASPDAAERAMRKTIKTKRLEGYRNKP